jgi:hypothetical protein
MKAPKLRQVLESEFRLLGLLDSTGDNQELLAEEGVLREKLPLGACEVGEEPLVTPRGIRGVGSRAARTIRRPAPIAPRHNEGLSKLKAPNTSHLCPPLPPKQACACTPDRRR